MLLMMMMMMMTMMMMMMMMASSSSWGASGYTSGNESGIKCDKMEWENAKYKSTEADFPYLTTEWGIQHRPLLN